MAPEPDNDDQTLATLRTTLCSENTPLARRFRSLFSLKHLASLSPPTAQTLPAIEAIAVAFASPSALLKHELAYCLGQSGKAEAIPYLVSVVEDRQEDAMCRHEAAEALGALDQWADEGVLALLRGRRDDEGEVEVVRETAEIAVGRIEWSLSAEGREERLKKRCVISCWRLLLLRVCLADLLLQRLRVDRSCAASGFTNGQAINTRPRSHAARHFAPAVPTI